ncbi:MAG: hypothetical protein K0R34_2149 [Herbinix sp.]|jgi:hypothetical protein|nr:hypothetical protein [Herbinix sp.]
MTPVRTETTNCILRGNTPDVMDLPVTQYETDDGILATQSCFELSEEEIREVIRSGRIYFSLYGNAHPPICLSTTPFVEEVN